jgi:hypothetical protein
VEQLSFEIGCFAGGFPGLANVPDIPLFVTVYRWAKEHNLSWTPDEARLEVTTRIRSFLADQKRGQVLRIEGPAGVGKTRVALKLFANTAQQKQPFMPLIPMIITRRSYSRFCSEAKGPTPS